MQKLDELKRRLKSMQAGPIFSKPAAAEECLVCAVQLLEEMDLRFEALLRIAGLSESEIESEVLCVRVERGN